MTEEMTKYGVEEVTPEKVGSKGAEVCPRCGSKVETHGQTRICPACGSAPFEPEDSEGA